MCIPGAEVRSLPDCTFGDVRPDRLSTRAGVWHVDPGSESRPQDQDYQQDRLGKQVSVVLIEHFSEKI